MNQDFNPRSVDAMFATILTEQKNLEKAIMLRLDQQDRTSERIEKQVLITNGRVTKHEQLWKNAKLRAVTITMTLGAVGGAIGWAVEHGLHHLIS